MLILSQWLLMSSNIVKWSPNKDLKYRTCSNLRLYYDLSVFISTWRHREADFYCTIIITWSRVDKKLLLSLSYVNCSMQSIVQIFHTTYMGRVLHLIWPYPPSTCSISHNLLKLHSFLNWEKMQQLLIQVTVKCGNLAVKLLLNKKYQMIH